MRPSRSHYSSDIPFLGCVWTTMKVNDLRVQEDHKTTFTGMTTTTSRTTSAVPRPRYIGFRKGGSIRNCSASTMTSTMMTASSTSMAIALLVLLITLSSSIFISEVHALPKFIVIDGRPKCFTVEVPKMTILKVYWEAPDIELDPDSKKYAPAYVTLLERPVETAASYSQDDDDGSRETSIQSKLNRIKKKKKELGIKTPRPVSKELKDHSGSFTERIQNDAVVDVCVRSTGAGQKSPMIFGLRTEQLGDALTELEREFETEATTKKHSIDSLYAHHNKHYTFLETQLDRIEHEMHAIISEADFFKDRDSIYHQQTDALHQATTFWPILQIIILLATGFTQANHIVRFFKAHRII